MDNYQRHLIQFCGFCDGAGNRPMNPRHIGNADYEKGYTVGQKAKRAYGEQCAKDHGIEARTIVLHNFPRRRVTEGG